MTYLQDATYSNTIVGTSSNGVSQIAYVMPWKDQSHEGTDILLLRPKSSESATPIQWEYDSDGSESERITQLILDRTKRQMEESLDSFISAMHSWFPFISNDFSSHATASFYSDPTTSLHSPSVYWYGRFVTADIEREVSYKTNIQYSQRREILDRFDVLAQREDNWDGYESKKPNQLTLNHAKFLMVDLLDTIISAEYSWITPFISSDENGYITAEWYEGERELHLLIGENEAECLQIWGINIDTEMREGTFSRDDYLTHWKWLLHG